MNIFEFYEIIFYREKIHKRNPDMAYGDDYDNQKKNLYTFVFFIY